MNTVYETFFTMSQRTDDKQLRHSRMCPSIVDPLKGYDQETFNQLIEEEHSEATPKANRGIVLNATTKERTVCSFV